MNLTTLSNPASRLALISGATGLLIMLLFVISNVVLGDIDGPAADATALAISDFFQENGAKLEWSVGMRFIELFLAPIFAVGLAAHVYRDDTTTRALVIVGLMAQIWVLSVGIAANSIESILLFERSRLATEPEMARTFSISMYALFTIAVLPWSLVVLCFSEAGRRSKRFPVWLTGIGYAQAAAGVTGSVVLVQALRGDNWAEVASSIGFIGFALWVLLASLVLIKSGSRRGLEISSAGVPADS